ncbi:hypothetical protein [Flavobacterium pectinovorum]|uniref:DUF4935 domain-containing protein n=1 Tax=Flavobacterium pectinovorum TaxID=29533 RepID=A0AB36P615_9FLAO|nr:hypothetical protein [Flavobacterium pectinovorum]OXB07787.1 hypothetical protein B0A72_02670 [Flavobacterium pectinovorum]SHM80519.1 hypothetical protein SAMN05444387_3239 [Flavobacterium pectinovorum]
MNNQHLSNIKLEIGQSIAGQTKIYLDTNYWLKITDCKTEKDAFLCNLLIELVETKKVILPISEITFWEILKQSDLKSLKRSALIIDKLSQGISIACEKDRQRLEFLHFVKANSGKPLYNLNEIVWSKISIVILLPIFLKYDPDTLKPGFINFLSDISFENILTQLQASSNLKPFYYKDDIDALNQGKEKHKDENKNFHEMYLSELGGYLQEFEQDLNSYFEEFYFDETGNKVSDQERQDVNYKSWKNMIYNLSKLKKLIDKLPSYRIFPEMNAVARWNTNRKYKDGNDTFDFLHVSAALPYFDYFFTERELRTMIKQRKLDEIYNCTVLSNIDEILEILNQNAT